MCSIARQPPDVEKVIYTPEVYYTINRNDDYISLIKECQGKPVQLF